MANLERAWHASWVNELTVAGSHERLAADILAPAKPIYDTRISRARIPIIDRVDMRGEQARVYDQAKKKSGIVGGPYYAYIRLPKLFEACQNLRECLASGPLSRREQPIVNLNVTRHWNGRSP